MSQPALAFDFVQNPDDAALMCQRLMSLCRDDRLRLFRHVRDQAQPLPHVGILVKKADIVGWVIRIYSGQRLGAKVGEVFSSTMDFVLFANGFGAGIDVSNALKTDYTRLDAEGVEVEDNLWGHDLCTELTAAFGPVEVFYTHANGFESIGVLVQRTWELQPVAAE